VTRPSVLWLRRDLRLHDQPALLAAAEAGPVLPLFVLDPLLLGASGRPRVAFLYRTLRSLRDDLRRRGGDLVVRSGAPEEVVRSVVAESGAGSVHVSADHAPYGRARDARVEAALEPVPLVRTGSPYAVSPGRVQRRDGRPFQVYSAFYRAWVDHGWRPPAPSDPRRVTWFPLEGDDVPRDPELPAGLTLPAAGERSALAAWRRFRARALSGYGRDRDRPDLDATSRISPYLRFGSLHPRTLLADLGPSHDAYRRELAWREFYAAVLYFWPESAREYFVPRLASLPWSTGAQAERDWSAWVSGRTGYPLVDAGMRQLLGEAFMHNRVRMVCASFLVKDLHIEWTRGARHFMRHLVDGDLASNQHGWQWTAGTGTDPAPFFRVFNPTLQARRFDPDGTYVRRWVPELGGMAAPSVHEPWRSASGPPSGYVAPIVDHAVERERTLSDYAALRS
jgi:deoxyribodipyrimidine photo-lyase